MQSLSSTSWRFKLHERPEAVDAAFSGPDFDDGSWGQVRPSCRRAGLELLCCCSTCAWRTVLPAAGRRVRARRADASAPSV